MLPTVLFVVGPPGVGKTTFVRALFSGLDLSFVQKPKWTLAGERYCAAGHYAGGTFDGADTVPYNGVKEALAYWDEHLRTRALTVFDGDRFSHGAVLDFLCDRPVMPVCLYFKDDPELLAKRREARGSKQNASWVAGRATKARRFAEAFMTRGKVVSAPASWSTGHVVDIIRAEVLS